MADVITRFKVESGEYEAKVNKAKKSLNDFENSGKKAGGSLEGFANAMGLSTAKLGALGLAVTAGSAAVKVATDTFFASESNIDAWGRTVESVKGAYDVFIQSISNGDWSNFLTRLNEAIQGSRDLYDAFDRLGSIKANNAAAIALKQRDIQDLRLRKQNGENVDALLETATAELARLQSQEVEAGMAAGVKQMVNALPNSGLDEQISTALAEELLKGGYYAFDKYAAQYSELKAKGTETKTRYGVGGMGGSYSYTESDFNIENLSKQEQDLYKIAAAITERETTLQEGIANYATAVTQGSSALREEFRNNRYSQQGGKSGGTGGSTKVTGLTDAQIAKNVADATEEMQRLIDQWIELDDRAGSVNDVLLILNSENSLTEFAEEADEGLDNLIARMTETQNATKRLTAEWNAMQAGFRNQAIDTTIGTVASLGDAIGGTTGSIIKLIAAQAQQVVQGISTIASMKAQEDAAYAEMTAELGAAAASMMKAHSWIPFVGVAMGIGFVASMVAALMSLPKFAGGGLVGGTSYSGDTQLASVNSGELILNKAQQNSLANELQSGNTQPLRLSARMSGTDILFAINNALASEGKGQLITLR